MKNAEACELEAGRLPYCLMLTSILMETRGWMEETKMMMRLRRQGGDGHGGGGHREGRHDQQVKLLYISFKLQ